MTMSKCYKVIVICLIVLSHHDAYSNNSQSGQWSQYLSNCVNRLKTCARILFGNGPIILDDYSSSIQPHVCITPDQILDQNITFVLSPLGTGAICTVRPDGTYQGGDARGANAVDLQIKRDNAQQVASGYMSVISGGAGNTASGDFTTVTGGMKNCASGLGATVCAGQNNNALGMHAAVLAGANNNAQGNYSCAFGRNACAVHDGTLVWSDDSGESNFSSTGKNGVYIRAFGDDQHGPAVYIQTSETTALQIDAASNSWKSISMQHSNVARQSPIDPIDQFYKLMLLKLTCLAYKSGKNNTIFVDPEQFNNLFHLGDTSGITTQDMQGVLCAALQGMGQLYSKHMQKLTQRILVLSERIEALERKYLASQQ
ncbi:hypothetical protein J120_04720 [candidate division TM6 bacterium JCVI TM6SC1]|uniref:Peptidase S74 domain-containing protein n=1 Tax=candidate division TM6 bacterium JCVI TM6SC1 TaxID=1306947 RepID=A0A0D2GNM4_9BACT|nr:hypothetical protein J120_04720 [candidate division TM6 bacterium JCVI TM6SC1]